MANKRFEVFRSVYGIHIGVVILDPKWWMANEYDIREYCSENGIRCQQQGMVVQFQNDEEFTMFMLKWS